MTRLLIAIKKRFPWLWTLVEWCNGLLVRVLFGRGMKTVAYASLSRYHPAGCVFSLVKNSDIPSLIRFFRSQKDESFQWFKPHRFDERSLSRILKSGSVVMMRVSPPSDEETTIGYFFLRCFFIKKAFAGLIVDEEWRNQGIGSAIWEACVEICSKSRIKMLATISRDNIPSLSSCVKGTSFRVVKELDGGYILVNCSSNTQ